MNFHLKVFKKRFSWSGIHSLLTRTATRSADVFYPYLTSIADSRITHSNYATN